MVDRFLRSEAKPPMGNITWIRWAALAAACFFIVSSDYITVSGQKPSPGYASMVIPGKIKPLDAMTRRAVLDEPRMNIHHSVTNGDRLVEWLGKSGFERLDAEKLGLWMDSRIKNNDAYGSVVVLGRGFALPTYWNPPTNLYGSAISAREDAWSTSEAIFLSGT